MKLLSSPDRRRWITLIIVCLAQLMIVLDVTIVNVARTAATSTPRSETDHS